MRQLDADGCFWQRRRARPDGRHSGGSAAEELRILAWQGYADDDWVKEFEKETGADVNVVFIGTDDEIWAKIKGSEGKDFDLFAVNTAQLQRYIDAGLAAPARPGQAAEPEADAAALPGPVTGQGRHARRQGLRHSLRLRLDRHHLRHDKVKPPPTSMDVLWDPTNTRARSSRYDNGEHNFSFTALDDGHRDPFHLTDEQMQAIKEKLIDLKHNALSSTDGRRGAAALPAATTWR